jgi:integrase
MFPKFEHPDEVSRLDVHDYCIMRKRKGIAKSTLEWELKILCAFWNWMLDAEIASYNPFSGAVKRANLPPPEPRVITDEILSDIIATASTPFLQTFVLLAITTGLGPSALWALDWRDINFDEGLIVLTQKTGEEHIIPLRSDILALLKLARQKSGRILAKFSSTRRLSEAWKKLVTLSGHQGITLRMLRETLAVKLLRRGVPGLIVQKLLGYRTTVGLARYYYPLSDEELRGYLEVLPR